MIHIPAIRTQRLTVALRELTIGEALRIAAMPVGRHEEAVTAFLRMVATSEAGTPDPDAWTVQERTLAVCQYLAAVTDDGPDFAVGGARYSDYLMGDQDYPRETVEVAEIEGDRWHAVHLTGALACAIERTVGEVDGLNARAHWLVGRMAAQLHCDNAPPLDASGDIDAALVERMGVLCGFPESAWVRLQSAFWAALPELDHLFLVEVDDAGLIVLAKDAAAEVPPARFPVRAAITDAAQRLGGQSQATGA